MQLMTVMTVAVAVLLTFSQGQEVQDACAEGKLPEDLIVSNPRMKDIAAQHTSRCSESSAVRHFKGISLGYVTPWNNHGYDIAKWLGNKFTHISPVWLQILYQAQMKYSIAGTHDIDSTWVKEVKKTGAKLVPRILFDSWLPSQIQELIEPAARDKAINLIVNIVKKHSFDGIVLEGWLQLVGSGHVNLAVDFITQLSLKMADLDKDLILVVPPLRGEQTIFGSTHFDRLADIVTAFSVMTYDYSSHQRNPGPTSPLNWVKECVEALAPDASNPHRAKILLGLNFYGNHFTSGGPEAILGNQFIDLIKSLKGKMKLDKDSVENYVEIKTKSAKHTIYYPTLYSIKKRIQLAEELGTGLSIWELGQGLDYFYELL